MYVCILAFGIQRAMRMRRIGICSLSGSPVFSHVASQKTDFWGKKKLLNMKGVF
jgi:hypothetical protein